METMHQGLAQYRANKKNDFFGYDQKRGTCRHIDNVETHPFIKRCTNSALYDGTEKCIDHSPEMKRLKSVLGVG